MLKQSEKQSNGRVNHPKLNKPAWDPYNGCVPAPLGSPTRCQNCLSRTVYCTVSLVHGGVYSTGTGYGVWDWVGTGEGYTGAQRHCSREGSTPAKRAPEGLQGLEWVGVEPGTSVQHHPTTPCGRARFAGWCFPPRAGAA